MRFIWFIWSQIPFKKSIFYDMRHKRKIEENLTRKFLWFNLVMLENQQSQFFKGDIFMEKTTPPAGNNGKGNNVH